MKLTKQIIDGTEVYFENGVKKYEYYKDSNGYEVWREYDSKGNNIYFKDSNGFEVWKEYDSKGNEIHFKDSSGYEWRKKYNPEEEVEVEVEVDIEPFIFKNK